MRNTVDFGNVVFGSDARLLEIKERRSRTSLLRKNAICFLRKTENLKIKYVIWNRNPPQATRPPMNSGSTESFFVNRRKMLHSFPQALMNLKCVTVK